MVHVFQLKMVRSSYFLFAFLALMIQSINAGLAISKSDNSSHESVFSEEGAVQLLDSLLNRVLEVKPNVAMYQQQNEPTKGLISENDLQVVLDNSFSVMSKELYDAEWHGLKPSDNSIFFQKTYVPREISTAYGSRTETTYHNYMPFIQKIVVKPNAQIMLYGDMHGDILTLRAFLKDLITKGFLNEDYSLVKDDTYLVFLGDYVDRGCYGLECLYTILQLKCINSDRVILLRGNHEDIHVSSSFYDFNQELSDKFSGLSSNRINELKQKINRLFDFMPVAVYFGCKDQEPGITNFVQICHGGIQEMLEIGDFLDDYRPKLVRLLAYEVPQKARITPYENVGFLWNDFSPQKQRGLPDGISSIRGLYDEEMTLKELSRLSTENSRVRGIIRGHQHGTISASNNRFSDMMKLIFDVDGKTPAHRGVAKLWREPGDSAFNTERLWDGVVVTLGATPDNLTANTVVNASAGTYSLTFYAYGILIPESLFDDWRLKMYELNFKNHILGR